MTDDLDFSPRAVRRGAIRWAPTAAVVVLLLIGAGIGAWRLGWWFTAQDVNRQAHITQNGYANQSGLLAQLNIDLSAVQSETVQIAGAAGQQKADLISQRAGTAKDACAAASQITISTGTDRAWIARNCDGGTLSASSPLAK